MSCTGVRCRDMGSGKRSSGRAAVAALACVMERTCASWAHDTPVGPSRRSHVWPVDQRVNPMLPCTERNSGWTVVFDGGAWNVMAIPGERTADVK